MEIRNYPTVAQANIMFFFTAVATLLGSMFFQPKLGIRTNLWINEFVYILLPPVLLAYVYGWSFEDVYRYKKTSKKNQLLSIVSGAGLWFFMFYISIITRMLLDRKVGIIINPGQASLSVNQNLLLIIGMIVLAPICEETFFRGCIQKSYEGYKKRIGFIITGIIFGSYHILNGISEVIPATILGICMGYLVYRTDSITTSILFHVAVNACAVFLGGSIGSATATGIPIWLHILAISGLLTSMILLPRIESEHHREEPNDEERLSVLGIVFLGLSALFLLSIGVLEILTRLNIVKT